MPYKDRVINVKIHKDTHDLLKEHKDQTGVNITFTVEKAIQEYFQRINKQKGE